MRDNAHAASLGDKARHRFRVELSIEDHHPPRLGPVEKVRKLPGDIPGGQNVLAQKITGRLVIVQVVNAQDPAQAWQTQWTQRDLLPFEIHQIV